MPATVSYRQGLVELFADTLAGVIKSNGMTERADIQSFDFRTLLRVQEKHPAIRTVYLFGDFPVTTDPARLGDNDDGTNLLDEQGKNTPWLACIGRTGKPSSPIRSAQEQRWGRRHGDHSGRQEVIAFIGAPAHRRRPAKDC
ncbi:MAG: hypothetical protein PHE55_23235 [Methylococcaceae bacterium]|nr:hypothetical protein [Methylococcaceae bacterium]